MSEPNQVRIDPIGQQHYIDGLREIISPRQPEAGISEPIELQELLDLMPLKMRQMHGARFLRSIWYAEVTERSNNP